MAKADHLCFCLLETTTCQAGPSHYANTGDWIESCTALMEDYQGEIHLLHYSDQVQWQTVPAPQEEEQPGTAQAA